MGSLTENFSWGEFECNCGCGEDFMDISFINRLQRLRSEYGQPIFITSGFRCGEYNESVGGSSSSSHLKGLAADISYENSTERYGLILAALTAGFSRIGLGKDFIHLDMDKSKSQQVMWLY